MKKFNTNTKQETQSHGTLNLIIIGFFVLFFWWVSTLPPAPVPEQNFAEANNHLPLPSVPGPDQNSIKTNNALPSPNIFNDAWIKSLSSDIESVSFSPYTIDKGKTFLERGRVEIILNTATLWGGAQDWNSAAATIHSLSKELLARKEPAVIDFVFRSTENNNFDWARIVVERKKLPENWQELTYLNFFGLAKPLPQNLQAGQWLCEFYNKYKSSRPNNRLPEFCNGN